MSYESPDVPGVPGTANILSVLGIPVREVGGEIIIVSRQGTTFTITFPEKF
jgi:hypothetical protein